MSESILTSTKKTLNLPEDYKAFDHDLITFINMAFLTLTQLGVGSQDGFSITDASTTWDDFLPYAPNLDAVKSYVSLKVRLMFDPPSSSFVIDAIQKQIAELEWRLNVAVDPENWS